MLGQVSGCHTKHPWFADPERRVSIGDMMIKTEDTNTWAMMSPEAVLLAAQAFNARHVVITGGDPALYDLRPLTTLLVGSGSRCNWRHRAPKPFR